MIKMMKFRKRVKRKNSTEKAKKRKILIRIFTVFAVALTTFAILLIRSCRWMLKTWTGLTMDELLYHLNTSLGGTNLDMIWDFVYYCVIITVVGCAVMCVICAVLRKRKILYGSLLGASSILSVIGIGVSIHNVWTTLDVSAYTENKSTYSTFIDDNYVDPRDVSLEFPSRKRNLIYIFLESMENTYSDEKNGGAFEENLIPELTQLSEENENFSGTDGSLNGGYSMPGTTWTIGAMFGQSTGLPLNIPISQNSMDTQESFFPDIISLGDILESAGYRQTLMIGSEASFGGRELYYEEHGDYDICDYNYAAETGLIPSDYRVWWGYEDRRLFEFAKDKLVELSETDQPFNFTLLTADTHFEDGYTCEDCPDTYGDNVYANVMACSSKKVAEFVQWIQQQDFYENTTIVISGDHLTMDSDFCEDVPADYQRKVYTTYINSAVASNSTEYRSYTTFDNFPTTLASLGVKIEGERLGLGTNLFSGRACLSEIYGYETEAVEVSKSSKLMEKLTANIKDPEEIQVQEEQIQEEQQPVITADLNATMYDYHTGKFTVSISNIQSQTEIQSIRCAVWPDDDQSRMIWYETVQNEDGSYSVDVRATDFGFQRGNYNIHVYAVDTMGNPILIGGIGQTI